jgi:hypothetical protein
MKFPRAKTLLVFSFVSSLLGASIVPANQIGAPHPDVTLTLLTGPFLLSRADATGQVVPGQKWHYVKIDGSPAPGRLTLGGSNSASSPNLSGPLMKVRRAKPRLTEAGLRFDAQLPELKTSLIRDSSATGTFTIKRE